MQTADRSQMGVGMGWKPRSKTEARLSTGVYRRGRARVLAENVRLSRVEAEVYDQNHFEIFHPWEQARLRHDLTRYGDCGAVLDVGAGTGNVVTKVSARHRVAVDLSAEMLLRLREKDRAVHLVLAFAEALPFADATFDLVVTYSTLHHLADWSPLAEMRRVTRPGGVVLLDHEEAFQERGWGGVVYAAIRTALALAGRTWYWRRPAARPYLGYRRVHWPYSEKLGPIDFCLTDGGHPDPEEIECELRRLGMTVHRRHYLLLPLPMMSPWQRAADRACRRLRLGHFAIEAAR
jgi:ubiquinone/menaquinone biosynthesis C-methylase UbiE